MTRVLTLALVLLAACSNSPSKSPQGPNAPAQPSSPPSDPAPTAAPPSGPTAPATPSSDPAVDSPAPAVTGSLTVTDGAGAGGPFKIGVVSRLHLAGSCASASPGRHTLRFNVLSPSGTVYASLAREVDVSDSGTASAEGTLELHGSTIESYMRTGTWNVTLNLDGGDSLVSADLDLTR